MGFINLIKWRQIVTLDFIYYNVISQLTIHGPSDVIKRRKKLRIGAQMIKTKQANTFNKTLHFIQ